MKKDKIIFLLDNSYHPDHRVENEINALIADGHQIRLHCVVSKHLPEYEEREGLEIYRNVSDSLDRPFSKEYREFVKSFVEVLAKSSPKIVHCHDFRMFLIGCKIKAISPETKLIYDSHEYLKGYPYYRRTKSITSLVKGFFIWNYYNYQEGKNLKNADHIITVSTSIRDLLSQRSDRRGLVIRNLPPVVRTCQSDCSYWHDHFEIDKNIKVIVHTGNAYFSRSRMEFLLDVIEQNPKLALVFLGTNRSINEIKEYVEQNGLKSVYFHENVDRQDITYYCSQADIGLVYTWKKNWQSYWFALPNKMMDVSLSGLPIICPEQPELKKFVDVFHHGVTFNGDKRSSLESAIEKLLDQYEVLKKNAESIESRFNWQLESQKLKDLYQDLI